MLYLTPMLTPEPLNSVSDLEAHRTALTGHCYRMLGSVVDADDAVQETMVRGWRALKNFDGRSSLRTWLYRIATNVCLDQLKANSRRLRPMEEGPAGTIHDDLVERSREHWLEPVLDAHVIQQDETPATKMLLRESIRLAFVATLQFLTPRQRAALLLTHDLGFSAQEVADALEMSIPAVNSAVQRARATLQEKGSDIEKLGETPDPVDTGLLNNFVDAFHRYDTDALASLLSQDAIMCMPPLALWLQGQRDIVGWFLGRGIVCKNSKLVPVAASGSPAFAQYHLDEEGKYTPWSLIVLEVKDQKIVEMTYFLDTKTLFPRFSLPTSL